jgi:D-alanine-D-alanine ligase
MTAVILHNGIKPDSPEDILDIPVQAQWVAEILISFGLKTVMFPFSLRNINDLADLKNGDSFFVVNLMDSAPGEENYAYLVPFVLEALRIPYTGCPAEALFMTTNKVLTKRLLRDSGLPTPEWVTADDGSSYQNDIRYIIKALCEDASVGMDSESVVSGNDFSGLASAISGRAARSGKAFFAERYIDGREFNVCIYGKRDAPVVLPPYEWLFPGFEEAGREKIIHYDAKWTENTFEYDRLEARYHLPDEDCGLISELIGLSEKCWRIFGLNGYARIDYRIDGNGKPWILEINANPSFYGFYHIAREYGPDFGEIIKSIIEAI